MKTRLILIALTLMFSIRIAKAQNDTRTSFAILGGINFQNLNGKDSDGDKLENEMILGYHAGINIQIPIAPEFYFQPGLLFSTKGAKNEDGLITSTYNLSYIELPLNFVYKALLGKGSLMIGFGPYIGYGVGGKATFEGDPLTLESDIEFTNTVEITDPLLVVYFKALDAGGNIFAGYEMANGIFLQFNTQLGMLKINPEDKRILNDESAVKNTGFGFSLGYRF
jgi:hypothetical protein